MYQNFPLYDHTEIKIRSHYMTLHPRYRVYLRKYKTINNKIKFKSIEPFILSFTLGPTWYSELGGNWVAILNTYATYGISITWLICHKFDLVRTWYNCPFGQCDFGPDMENNILVMCSKVAFCCDTICKYFWWFMKTYGRVKTSLRHLRKGINNKFINQ